MRNPSWDRAMRDVRQLTAAARRTECRAYHLWDGFDHYNASTELWSAINGTPSYSPSYARFTAPAGLLGQGMKMPLSGASWKQWNMVSNQPTMIFGFAFLLPSIGAGGGMMQLYDTGTAQVTFGVNAAGGFYLQSGTIGSTLASSAPGLIQVNTWYWIDVQITISSTVGAISVYINQPKGGAASWTATGLNTQRSANAYMNIIYLGDFGATYGGALFDDFHAHDITGSAPNSILGDSRIYTKKANGAGYATNWTPNGAAANWQCSDDSPPDGDTTYNSSNTPGAIDGYAVPTAGFTVAPNGLVRKSYVRRDDAGPHTFQNGIRSSGTNGLGTAFTAPSTYAWTDGQTCYVNDPSTGSPWATAAAADAASMVIDETS